jgi:hypothetical protein
LLCHGCIALKTNRNEREIYKHILTEIEILNTDTWSEGDEKHLRYGEKNITNMWARFGLEKFRYISKGIRKHFDDGGETSLSLEILYQIHRVSKRALQLRKV